MGQRVGHARLKEGRPLVAAQVAPGRQVGEGLVHHDDDGGLQLVVLRLGGMGGRGVAVCLRVAGDEVVFRVSCRDGGVAGRLVDRQVLRLGDEGGQEALRLEVGDLPLPPVLDLDVEEVLIARHEHGEDQQGERTEAQDEGAHVGSEPAPGGDGAPGLGGGGHAALRVGPVEDERADGTAGAGADHRPEHAGVEVVLVAAADRHGRARGEDVAEHEHRVFELQDKGLDDAEGGEVAYEDRRRDRMAQVEEVERGERQQDQPVLDEQGVGPDEGKLGVPGDLERGDAKGGGHQQHGAAVPAVVGEPGPATANPRREVAAAEHGVAGQGDRGGAEDAGERVAGVGPADHPDREHGGKEGVGARPVGVALERQGAGRRVCLCNVRLCVFRPLGAGAGRRGRRGRGGTPAGAGDRAEEIDRRGEEGERRESGEDSH